MLKRKLCIALIKKDYGDCHIEWIAPDKAVVTTADGHVDLLTYHRFDLVDFAQWLIPTTICLWSLIIVSGVVLGCFYGKII